MPAASIASIGIVYQHARVTSARSGRSRSHTSITALRRDLLALVRDDLVAHLDRAEMHHRRAEHREPFFVDDRDVGLGARLGVLVGVVVLAEHTRRDRAVSSSSTRYCRPWCRYTAPGCATANTRASSTVPIVRSSSRSIEPVLERRAGAQPDVARGRSLARPVHASRRAASGGRRARASRTASSRPSPNQRSSSGASGQLVRRARDLGAQHERVLRVDDRALGRAMRQLARVRGVPLVELVVAGDEHRGRTAAGAPGAAGLLPHRRERAGEAVEDRPRRDRRRRCRARARWSRRCRAACRSRARVRARAAPRAGSRRGTRRPGSPAPTAPASRRRRACAATSSAPRRLRVNARRLVPGAHEAGEQVGGLDVRRRARARVRVEQRSLPARRAPSRRAASRRRRSPRPGRPHSADASSPGFPIVALAKQNVGCAP